MFGSYRECYTVGQFAGSLCLETVLRCFSSLFSDLSGLNKMWSRVGYFSQSRPRTNELEVGKQKMFGTLCAASHTSHANAVPTELAEAASVVA